MQTLLKQQPSLFKAPSIDTLELIRTLNREKKCTFLIPAKFISCEAGQVGYLLNEYFNDKRAQKDRVHFRTFYANSHIEALHGSIKISRHYAYTKNKNHQRHILIFDPTQRWDMLTNPVGRTSQHALIPGIHVTARKDQLIEKIERHAFELCALIVPASHELETDFINELFEFCREKEITPILDDSKNNFKGSSLVHQLKSLPSIIISGEELTDNEIPFASFSMSAELNQPWKSFETCFVHSSTYGGNRLSLTKVRNRLLNDSTVIGNNSIHHERCRKISESDHARVNSFADYVNPGLAGLFQVNGLDFDVKQAHGSKLILSDNENREVIDGISGGGTAARGHTPSDIIEEVLDTFDHKEDYWSELQQKMRDLTGLEKSFPAISGTTAVENGIISAMLANHQRTRIVTFKENFAGKTLIALNASDSHEMELRAPFNPLYFDVVYIDPFAKDSKEKLSEELTSGEVALVWFELVQGSTERSIPHDLLELIRDQKDKYQYFVGIDEILAGFYRTGNLFTYQKSKISPDILTFSKVLSDATYPMGMTLVSKVIYDKAEAHKPDVVSFLDTHYINQLGSHIACHFIEKMTSSDLTDHVAKISNITKNGFKELAKKSALVKEVCGEGLLLRIYYRYDHPFMKCLGKLGSLLFPGYMCRLLLKEGRVFILMDRFIPALSMSEEEAKTMIKNLEPIFERKPFIIYIGFLGYVIKLISFAVLSTIKRK